MTTITLRTAVESDFSTILKLNDIEIQQTSHMDLERLRFLDQISCYHKVALVGGQVAAFLLAMRDGASYQNDNYNWFAARFPHFVYVDRIVVSADFFGLKMGSTLYNDLFTYAQSQGIKSIVCEYNIKPPNLASKAFHDKFGFHELGTQWVANRTKLVSLQEATI